MPIIKTLSDAVTLVEFIMHKQGKSVEEAIIEAGVPEHLQALTLSHFAPPLEFVSPDLITDNQSKIQFCNPTDDSPQQYFGAFQRYLIDVKRWNWQTVNTIADTSKRLIERLPKPELMSEFQVRGLVLGHIQSGKTASMAALITRAADEGYKLFIVLSGFWKDLRAQTQKRMDQEIIGYSDDPNDAPYTKHDAATEQWVRLTQSGLAGDFEGGPNDLNPRTPKLAVIKKNKRIELLTKWLDKSPVSLRELPAVIIDDEADQGSIDTNYGRTDDEGNPIDPTATNKRIRELLELLPKCVYVGFTATPFANVLIDVNVEDDLYPRDFIATLPEPPNYFGPRKLFGLGLTPSDLSPSTPRRSALDIIRQIQTKDSDEIDRCLSKGGDCPKVLADALLAFLLSSCCRLARGHTTEHFSMLVHPSQQIKPHERFAETIAKELQLIRNATLRSDRFPEYRKRAAEMWENDFKRVIYEQNDPQLLNFEFDEIWSHADTVAQEIEIMILNNESSDKLDYSGSPKRYIVVGGNRLSRGLTLEGLSVSLFTRTTNQYDTLLQMGRWFGFRPNYHDLTRIYVENTMAERFAELARVEEELRADLKKYAEEPNPASPKELMPRIRMHPSMAVTSRLKMGAGRPVQLSYNKSTQQTIVFPIDKADYLKRNIETASQLITDAKDEWMRTKSGKAFINIDVDSKHIISFLENYIFQQEALMNSQSLTAYIKRQNEANELTLWDVVLAGGNPDLPTHQWSKKLTTHKVKRTPRTPHSIGVLSDPGVIADWEETTKRSETDKTHGCLMLYVVDRKSDSESDIKFAGDPTSHMDIIGFVIKFPESNSNATVQYISQG